MKRLVLVIVAIGAISMLAVAQDAEIAKLNQKIASLYQQGKFDEAIPVGEKIVSIEKKASKSSEAYAVALTNLAQLNKEKAKSIRTNLAKFDPKNRYGAVVASREAAENAKKLYRDALEIYTELKLTETSPVAALKNELAWVVFSFTVSDSIRESRSQIDDAERLYTEALATADSLAPAEADLQMLTLKNFAEFYMLYVNFEKALPLYQRHVAVAESKYGAKGKQILDGLRGLYEINWINGREAESASLLARIKDISGNSAEPAPKYRNLTARSRGIAKVDADGFSHSDLTDLDRSYKTTSEIQRKLTAPGQYSIKSIEVELLVNEDGSVAEAKVVTPSKYTKQVEEAAMASKFRPFEYDGKRQQMKGKISFQYKEF